MKTSHYSHPALLALLLSILNPQLSTVLAQGSLTPPGPPGPMFKTLDQVQPRTPISSVPYSITIPGSYYFTTNLVGPGGTNGVTIQADNVTLDLAGFALLGPGNNGIYIPSGNKNISVRNGIIRGWSTPVYAFNALNSTYDHLLVSDNAAGFDAGSNAVVSACIVQQNSVGLFVDDGSTVTDCIVVKNFGVGFTTASAATVRNCTIQQNGSGLYLGSHCVVNGCLILKNGGTGITGGDYISVTRCTVNSNSASGIQLGSYSLVSGCVVDLNRGTGILINSNNRVLDNQCSFNSDGGVTGSAGIRATGSGNRIEGNTVISNNLIGIAINNGQTGNVIIRNNAHNSADYSYPVGNLIGPIISTNSGADVTGVITNLNPWANFSN